jgi:hypothetical protein
MTRTGRGKSVTRRIGSRASGGQVLPEKREDHGGPEAPTGSWVARPEGGTPVSSVQPRCWRATIVVVVPRGAPPGYEPLKSDVPWDPAYLELVSPERVFTLEEFGDQAAGWTAPSPVAITTPSGSCPTMASASPRRSARTLRRARRGTSGSRTGPWGRLPVPLPERPLERPDSAGLPQRVSGSCAPSTPGPGWAVLQQGHRVLHRAARLEDATRASPSSARSGLLTRRSRIRPISPRSARPSGVRSRSSSGAASSRSLQRASLSTSRRRKRTWPRRSRRCGRASLRASPTSSARLRIRQRGRGSTYLVRAARGAARGIDLCPGGRARPLEYWR